MRWVEVYIVVVCVKMVCGILNAIWSSHHEVNLKCRLIICFTLFLTFFLKQNKKSILWKYTIFVCMSNVIVFFNLLFCFYITMKYYYNVNLITFSNFFLPLLLIGRKMFIHIMNIKIEENYIFEKLTQFCVHYLCTCIFLYICDIYLEFFCK